MQIFRHLKHNRGTTSSAKIYTRLRGNPRLQRSPALFEGLEYQPGGHGFSGEEAHL